MLPQAAPKTLKKPPFKTAEAYTHTRQPLPFDRRAGRAEALSDFRFRYGGRRQRGS